MSKKKTKEEFILESEKIHGKKYLYCDVEYINNNVKVNIICPIHGKFEVRPNDHLSKKVGCNKCNNAGLSKKNNLSKKIVDKFNIVHNNYYDYSLMRYNGTDNKIEIICPNHGVFNQTPHHHLNGHGCQECKNVKPLSNESFIFKSKEINGDLYDYSLVNYFNYNTKVKIICLKHGIFEQSPNDHLGKKTGCPICKESNGENIVRKYLSDNHIKYIPQHRFKDCRDKNPLPFDFYLPEYNTCIEYDGEQHFKAIGHWGGEKGLLDRQKKDRIKNEYCKNKDRRLVRVKYNDNIIEKLNEIVKTYEQ